MLGFVASNFWQRSQRNLNVHMCPHYRNIEISIENWKVYPAVCSSVQHPSPIRCSHKDIYRVTDFRNVSTEVAVVFISENSPLGHKLLTGVKQAKQVQVVWVFILVQPVLYFGRMPLRKTPECLVYMGPHF